MRILLVAASELELKPILNAISAKKEDKVSLRNNEVSFFVSGVGLLPMAVNLMNYLNSNSFDLIINLGIVGAVKGFAELGEVIEVISDQQYLEGAEDKENFKSIYDLGLRDKNEFPFEEGLLKSTFCHVTFPTKKARGISLNLVHGNANSIKLFEEMNIAEVESMEGAAFFYTCNSLGIKCAQIKAISNYIEIRHRENWKIDLALKNLSDRLIEILEKI